MHTEASKKLDPLKNPDKIFFQALRKLQLASVKLEAEFYKKVHELECQYADQFQKLNDDVSMLLI